MQEAIQKADVLIEALNWIRRFRDKITVIKLGGSLLEDESSLRHILIDVIFMETVGMRPVIVHGGGAAISKAMAQAGIKPNFIMGRRYTDPQTLEIVQRVLATETCESIAKRLTNFGGRAQSLNFQSTNVLKGEQIKLLDDNGQPVDLGSVGRVTQVDTTTIHKLLREGVIPVIPSMCEDAGSGQKLNVNADTAATTVAQQLGAEKLIYLSDVNGVRTDKDDPDTLIHSLDDQQAKEMIASGQVAAGMIPKIEACLETLEQGVQKVHIIDGRLRHSLLLEIYTTQGVGTVISKK